jgi:GT2 family glycosyltransferase/SAM-dependent methyltransferase
MGGQWEAISMSQIRPVPENIPRHLQPYNPGSDPEFRQWVSERESIDRKGGQDRLSTGEAFSPALNRRGWKNRKALLIQLDFQTWSTARPWSYCAAYGVQEGLAANGVECVTMPTIAEHLCSTPASWLYHAKTFLSGQQFDQVWVWLVHTSLDEATMEWLSKLAPVRVGVMMESLQYDAEDYVWAPQLKSRRKVLDSQMPYLTHVLSPDEQDVVELTAIGQLKALWWPAMVPERFIVSSTTAPTQSNAVFHGTPYGRRQSWTTHPLLQQHMHFFRADQPPTKNQQLFDQLQRAVAEYLQSGQPVMSQVMREHAESLQKIRMAEFSEWMTQLPQWPAIVNLPSLAKFYGGRVMEGMAVGRPVISWHVPNHPHNLALFEPDKEILLFNPDDPAALVAQIDRLRRDPKYAVSVARNGQDRVRRYHTAERRLRETLCWLRDGVEPRYGIEMTQCPSIPARSEVATPAVAHKTQDEFYVDLFVKKPHWSTPEPNADEAARWSKIAAFLEYLLRRVRQQEPNKQLRMLDVGCGRGWLTNLATAYGTCEGIEPVAGVVEWARTLFPYLRIETGMAESVLSRPDFAPYDVVLTSEVIEHVPHGQKERFLAQLAQLLKPDGHLILTTPRGEMWEQWSTIAPPNQPVEDWVTEDQLCALFASQGFMELGRDRIYVEVPNLRFIPAPTPADLCSMNLLPIYQVWVCQRTPAPDAIPFTRPPKVSVIVPTYNRPDRLRTALESLAGQTFQDFEVIVVNDGGCEVGFVIAACADRHRITSISHDRNRGLAAARNSGLRAAKGTYIAYLDDDDRYLPHHLETLVRYLERGECRVAYTDAWRVHEQQINGEYIETERDLPYSYDFSPADLLVGNYFPVLCVMHARQCLDQVGFFDESLFAHEDWDLWIRMATRFPFKHLAVTTAEFTWRGDGTSMTSGTSETYRRTMELIYRKYAPHAEQIAGVREAQAKNLKKLHAKTPAKSYVCSIVIPVWNRLDLTRECLMALSQIQDQPEYEVIVVDNGSTDGTQEFLQTLGGDVQVIVNSENLGFAKACNQGAQASQGKYLVFLNNDTVPKDGWLRALVHEVESDEQVGIVGSKLLYADGTIQHAGVVFARGHLNPYHLYQRFSADHPAVNHRREPQVVTAACLLIRRGLFDEVGGFDEGFRNGFEDVDLCLKSRQRGYRVIYQPRSVLYHLESQTPGRKAYDSENWRRLYERWKDCWWLADADIHYHADGYKLIWAGGEVNRNGHLELMTDNRDRAAWAHVAATQVAATKQDWEQVRRELSLYQDWPADSSVLLWAGMICERLHEEALQMKFLARYLELEDDTSVRLRVIRGYLEQRDLGGADQQLQKLLSECPAHAEGLLLKGILGMQREQYEHAEMAFDAAMQEGADRKKCLMGMGMAAMGRAYTQGAWERFLQVLVEYPDDAEAIHWLLRVGTAQNRWQELGEHLGSYVRRNPGDLVTRFALASVLFRGEQIEEARREYDALRQVAPGHDGLDQLGQAITGREAALAFEATSS